MPQKPDFFTVNGKAVITVQKPSTWRQQWCTVKAFYKRVFLCTCFAKKWKIQKWLQQLGDKSFVMIIKRQMFSWVLSCVWHVCYIYCWVWINITMTIQEWYLGCMNLVVGEARSWLLAVQMVCDVLAVFSCLKEDSNVLLQMFFNPSVSVFRDILANVRAAWDKT